MMSDIQDLMGEVVDKITETAVKLSEVLGGDPAEAKAPRKPRVKKLSAVEHAALNDELAQAELAEVVPQGTSEPIPMREIDEQMAALAEGYAVPFDARSIPTDPLPRQPSPKFKYEYQRIEYQKRVDRTKE